jgi:hypothetical protein
VSDEGEEDSGTTNDEMRNEGWIGDHRGHDITVPRFLVRAPSDLCPDPWFAVAGSACVSWKITTIQINMEISRDGPLNQMDPRTQMAAP